MRIKLISDVHLGSWDKIPNIDINDIDVLVIAGDLDERDKGLEFLYSLLEQNTSLQIIYVFGNHEYYASSKSSKYNLDNLYDTLKSINKYPDRLHILDNNIVYINNIKFIGCTLWTDINDSNPLDIHEVWNGLNDYKYIKTTSGKIKPFRTTYEYRKSSEFIKNELLNKHDKTVVVTHHKPFVEDEDKKFDLWSAFSNNFLNMFNTDNKPDYWLFGHTHIKYDKIFNGVRCVNNPYGYSSEKILYDDNLIVEII